MRRMVRTDFCMGIEREGEGLYGERDELVRSLALFLASSPLAQ